MSLNSASLRSSLHAYTQSLSNRRDLRTDQLNDGIELIRKIDSAIEAVQTKETSIAESTVLSDQGKTRALAELSTASASKFGFVSRVVESQERDLAGMKTALFTVKTPVSLGADPIVQYLAGKEMRDRFKDLTPRDLDMAFLKAAEVSDSDEQANRDAILWAFQETPGGPMITANILQRALEERAKRTQPAVVNRLRGLGGDQVKIFAELGGEEPVMSAKDTELARRQVHSAA